MAINRFGPMPPMTVPQYHPSDSNTSGPCVAMIELITWWDRVETDLFGVELIGHRERDQGVGRHQQGSHAVQPLNLSSFLLCRVSVPLMCKPLPVVASSVAERGFA